VLIQLGVKVRATGFLGGHGGQEIQDLLADSPLDQAWVTIQGNTRSTTAIHSDAGPTLFNEPGPTVTTADWEAMTAAATTGLDAGDVLVVSGSCPPGTTQEDLHRLLLAARAIGARTILDTSGQLLVAAAGSSDVLKPNREELHQATGLPDPEAGAGLLLDRGAQAVVVSAGPEGMDLFLPGGAWRATPPIQVQGNPTGAGDAAVAALAAGLLAATALDQALPATLASAVALSAAAVLMPTAGEVDLSAYRRFLPDVNVKQTNASR
jgi:1-phosphofructokinase/tagatose 6-phosphate kinase